MNSFILTLLYLLFKSFFFVVYYLRFFLFFVNGRFPEEQIAQSGGTMVEMIRNVRRTCLHLWSRLCPSYNRIDTHSDSTYSFHFDCRRQMKKMSDGWTMFFLNQQLQYKDFPIITHSSFFILIILSFSSFLSFFLFSLFKHLYILSLIPTVLEVQSTLMDTINLFNYNSFFII